MVLPIEGLAEAYLVALFTEMFGLPLTIYLLGSFLGVRVGLGMLEGHLWATLLARVGVLPLETGVKPVMAPVLMAVYLRLARAEERGLAERFGQEYFDYRERVPAFLPWPRPKEGMP